MIQFNLLPDVKLDYIKAKRTKRAVVLISGSVAAGALAILVVLFLGVMVFQKEHLKDLSADINTNTKKLNDIKDLDKILTIQNQLSTLPDLHKSKPVVSRLPSYLQQVTPASTSIANINIDLATGAMTLTGAADSLVRVNQFVDTLKFTTYKTGDTSTPKNVFSKVVLTGYGKDDKGASYNISLNVDISIFDSANSVTLTVPQGVSTRSETEQPGALFQPLSDTTKVTK